MDWSDIVDGKRYALYTVATRTVTLYNPDTGAQTGTRPFNVDENAQADALVAAKAIRDNRATILGRARTALTNNGTFLGITNPTTGQATTQVKALTRQVNGLIRLLALDDVSNIADS